MFARLLLAPLVFAALIFLYLAWQVDERYALGMVPLLVIAAAVYVLSPQLNWWWYKRRPPVLSPKFAALLERFSPVYRRLAPAQQQRYRERIELFRFATDWTPVGWPDETLPPDVQLAIAAQATALTLGREDFLFPKFEKVIVYPTAFPSPEFDFPHTSELYEPDGCLLFSAEHVMQAFLQPGSIYNIALHEYAKAFALSHPGEPYPDFSGDDAWPRLERVGGMSRQHIESVVGLAGLEAFPVAVHHYILFPDRFRAAFPDEAGAFDLIFNQ